MRNYSFSVQWSEEDEAYIALCVEFPGLSGIGDSAQQAIVELQVALAAAIETYQAEGWELPEPRQLSDYNGRILVRMPKSLHGRLVQQAEVEGVSLNTFIITALAETTGMAMGAPYMERFAVKMLRMVDTHVTRAMTALVNVYRPASGTQRVRIGIVNGDRRQYPSESSSASAKVEYLQGSTLLPTKPNC